MIRRLVHAACADAANAIAWIITTALFWPLRDVEARARYWNDVQS